MQGGDPTAPHPAGPRLIETEHALSLLIESVTDYAIFMLDPDGIVRTWNPGAQRLKGYPAAEIVGRDFSVFYTRADREAGVPRRVLQTALRDGRVELESWRVRKDGALFWANVVITAVYDESGRHLGFAKVTRDLTERRRAEEERLRLAHAEEAVRLRDEFLSIAAHELRTPLNAVQLHAAALRILLDPGRPSRLEPDQALLRVERLLQSTRRLATLITRLLDIVRIARGRLTLETSEMDLVATAKDVISTLTDLHPSARAPIVFRGPEVLVGRWDRLRIEQVVFNLLENAVTYGEGAPIEVRLDADDALVFLHVIDRGPGVPESDRPLLFERSGGRQGRGLGLGLYISRTIVEAHGGTIQLRSSTAPGAHFEVRLPRSVPPAEPEGTEAAP